jgi:hypothetical protein
MRFVYEGTIAIGESMEFIARSTMVRRNRELRRRFIKMAKRVQLIPLPVIE